MDRLNIRFWNGMIPTEDHFNPIVEKINEIIDEGTGKVQSDIVDLGEFARSGLGEAKAASIPYCSDPNILMMKYTITGQGVAIVHQTVNDARSTQFLVLAGQWFTRYITFTNSQRTAISQVTAWWRTMPTNVDYDPATHRVKLVDYNRQHSLPLNNANDGFVIPIASTTTDGLMSKEDKAKIDSSTKCAAYYYNAVEDAISVKDSRIQDGDTIAVYRTKKRRLSRHIEGSEDTATYTKGGRQRYENENNSFVIDGRGNNGYIHLRIRSNEVGGGGIYGIKEYVWVKYDELSYAAYCYQEGDLAGFWDSYREYQVIADKMMNLECDCELVVMRNGEVVCDGIFIKVRQTFTPTGNRVENEETGMVVWVKNPVDTQVQIK